MVEWQDAHDIAEAHEFTFKAISDEIKSTNHSISETTVGNSRDRRYIEFFHNGDPNNFTKQQDRDQLKKELCEENQIALWYYEDPYIIITKHLRELGLIGINIKL
ncbi:hypothetical protein RhiirC2_785145 [Rhizophagus irregularis]|uniref:Uncharacterized protein n=1 Tax=Rhizophagus irregularis TaxID=588596 RepID=A0A2N1MX45_9GLOM|nr:hypothetical protein RhiirC2_785145 [Rhizophagus irregularis]